MDRVPRPLVDSESDVAALVYGRGGEQPDLVIDRFVRDLRREGYDAVGLMQRRRGCGDDGRPSYAFYLLADDDPDRRKDASGTFVACVDGLRRALRRRPDLVALNRFGPWEIGGAGLLDVFGEALRMEIPIAIAVSEDMFGPWLAFARGLAVRLNCDRSSLDRWWRSVSRQARLGESDRTFCGKYR